MNTRLRNVLIIAGVLAAVIVIGVLFAPKGSSGVQVATIRVHTAPFQTKLPQTGEIQRGRIQVIAALVPGNLGEIAVHPGQRVDAGTLLVTIVNPELESNLRTAQAAYDAAAGRALKAAQTLPLENASAVVQARAALRQSEQDLAQGAQSGLGYGGSTAREQLLAADSDVSRTQTDLREAKRIADANADLYANKAISRDTLEQSRAKLEETRLAYNQAVAHRQILGQTLGESAQYLRERVRANRDALAQAEANLAATGPGDVAAAQADADRAREELEYARGQVQRMTIRAPFAGSVESIASETNDSLRQLAPGDAVTEGQALITLAGGDGFIVRAKVDEQDVASIAVGQRAIVSSEAFGDRKLTGRVRSIAGFAQRSDDASSTSRQVLTSISLDRSLPFLRDGMTVDVDIVTADLKSAIAVPRDAVHREKNAAYVFTLRDGKAHRVPVTTGPSNDTQIVIKRGLADGDVVITERNDLVHDGAAVSALPTASPSPSASP